MVVQWLRLSAPNARGPGSNPGQGIDPTCHGRGYASIKSSKKILRATTKTQGSQINKYCFEKCSWKMEKGLVVGSEETELPAADRTWIG